MDLSHLIKQVEGLVNLLKNRKVLRVRWRYLESVAWVCLGLFLLRFVLLLLLLGLGLIPQNSQVL